MPGIKPRSAACKASCPLSPYASPSLYRPFPERRQRWPGIRQRGPGRTGEDGGGRGRREGERGGQSFPTGRARGMKVEAHRAQAGDPGLGPAAPDGRAHLAGGRPPRQSRRRSPGSRRTPSCPSRRCRCCSGSSWVDTSGGRGWARGGGGALRHTREETPASQGPEPVHPANTPNAKPGAGALCTPACLVPPKVRSRPQQTPREAKA